MVAGARPGPSGPLLACWGKRASSRPFCCARGRPQPGSVSGAGELSLGPCISCTLHCHFSACSGSLGTLPWRGCWWVLGYETWYLSGLFIKSVPSGCQALSGAAPAPGWEGCRGAGFPVGETDENQANKQKTISLVIKMIENVIG